MSRSSSLRPCLAVFLLAASAAAVPPRGELESRFVSWSLADTPLDRTAAELQASTADHLAHARALHEQILAAAGARTVENTLEPLNDLYLHLSAALYECELFANVHPSETVRAAGDEGLVALDRYRTELSLDRALYDALAAVDLAAADEETRYAVAKELRDFRREGVDRPDEVRSRIAELNERLTRLGQDFRRNIAEDVREVVFEPTTALAGLPEDYVEQHAPCKESKVHIDTQSPDYQPFMQYAQNGEARRQLYLAYNNRAYPQNLRVLDDLVRTRHEKATLLNYESWAEYVTEDKMIGSDEAAAAFIDRIAGAAREAARRDYDALLLRKRQDDPHAITVEDWEKAYYGNLVQQEQYELDSQEVRQYFEYETVRRGIFELSARLFGVEFEPVVAQVWHEDVSAGVLLDEGQVIGRFYLDMHPRTDKYNHAACFPYRDGVAGKVLPQAVLVCNFPNPREGTALMEFGQVETFLHEFGHLLHHLFASTSRWAMNAGISTEWDFVEAPSQMLEEYLLDPETLRAFAVHHETGKPIPVELVEKLRAASEFGKGTNAAHQMFYAALSLNLFRRDPSTIDTTALVQELQWAYSPFRHVDGTHFQCSFGHLEGYSAIYYTYMWSQVIAKDLWSRFEAEGAVSPAVAQSYREAVLAPGGSRPAADLVARFLGRPFQFDAFEEWLKRQ